MDISAKSLQYGRRCQSPRTGFIHLFASEPGGDAIPLYENFCFALALIRQKTAEGVLEGKELLARLYGFQAPHGNFPVYLHDFPRCYNPLQPLRIAPLLTQLKSFAHVLGDEFNQKTARVLSQLLACATQRRAEKPLDPLWERRYQALLGQPTPLGLCTSSADWAEELITRHLLNDPAVEIARLVHPTLALYTGPASHEQQELERPKPTLLDWWKGAETAPHSLQLELAALTLPAPETAPWSGLLGPWHIRQTDFDALTYASHSPAGSDRLALRYLWHTHSLAVATQTAAVTIDDAIHFDLPDLSEVTRNDLVEVAVYCNLSPETTVTVDGIKATTFRLNEPVLIHTPEKTLRLVFSSADGAFFGHLSRGNRPFQTACKGARFYEAFDWKISLRTLRRSPRARVTMTLKLDE